MQREGHSPAPAHGGDKLPGPRCLRAAPAHRYPGFYLLPSFTQQLGHGKWITGGAKGAAVRGEGETQVRGEIRTLHTAF